MTPAATEGNHTGAGQCGGFAERFPKWNPVYVAYALARGAEPTSIGVLAFREQQTSPAEYIAWAAHQRELYRLERGIASFGLRTHEEKDFKRWLEARAVAPRDDVRRMA